MDFDPILQGTTLYIVTSRFDFFVSTRNSLDRNKSFSCEEEELYAFTGVGGAKPETAEALL